MELPHHPQLAHVVAGGAETGVVSRRRLNSLEMGSAWGRRRHLMPRAKPKTATGRPLEDFACPQQECSAYGVRGAGNLRFNGWSGDSRTYHMIQCSTCRRSFSELKGTAFERCQIGLERATAVLEHIQEGCGTRGTSRLTHVHRDTVTRLIRLAGKQAYDAHDELVVLSPPHHRGSARREVELRPHQGRSPSRRRAQPRKAR